LNYWFSVELSTHNGRLPPSEQFPGGDKSVLM
jgi:hypothetical protein